MKTLLVYAHPEPTSFCAAVRDAVSAALRAGGHELQVIDLYALAFDPVLSQTERAAYLLDTAWVQARVQSHVDALLGCEHLIFVYPTWFYGPPAILKGWLERVWLPGVAFLPPPKMGATAVPGLRHIRRLSVVTHGGAPWWWLQVMRDPGKRLMMRGLGVLMAKDLRKTWLQLHNMNNASSDDRVRFLARVTRTFLAMKENP